MWIGKPAYSSATGSMAGRPRARGCAACHNWSIWILPCTGPTKRSGAPNAMRELQSIGYEMSVTFCYRHYYPSVAAYHWGNGIDVGVLVEAPLASVVAGARIRHVAARLHGGIALSLPTTGLPLGWLAPSLGSQTTEREQAFERRAAPRPRLERGTYCLEGTFKVWLDSARCRLTCRLVVPAMAGCGLAWPSACRRWLPVRLPGISLPELTTSDPTRRRSLISFSLDSLAPTCRRDPRLPSEQPKKELMRCLMLVRKFSRSPTPRPADSPACRCAGCGTGNRSA